VTGVHRQPGYMTRARRLVREHLKLVHVVIEVADARVPCSSRHPAGGRLFGGRQVILTLNKADLADSRDTALWKRALRRQGVFCLTTEKGGGGLGELRRALHRVTRTRPRGGGVLRVMVCGLPNVGKSSVLNRLAGHSRTRTGGVPGITRGQQWITVSPELQLLDMPGVLWLPGAEDDARWRLAACGILEPGDYDPAAVACRLLAFIGRRRPGVLGERYDIRDPEPGPGGGALLEAAGRRLGCLVGGGAVDPERAGREVLGDFGAGRLGRWTLEPPPPTEVPECNGPERNGSEGVPEGDGDG